jgi:hypothetical protein
MKKVNRVFTQISLSIIVLFFIAVAGTYLSDYLLSINWFNDHIEIRNFYGGGGDYEYEVWGARHYWYNWSVGLLFLTSLARAVFSVVVISNKTYK